MVGEQGSWRARLSVLIVVASKVFYSVELMAETKVVEKVEHLAVCMADRTVFEMAGKTDSME